MAFADSFQPEQSHFYLQPATIHDKPLALFVGDNVLGRNEWTRITDRNVSRRQVVLTVNDAQNLVTARCVGRPVSQVICSGRLLQLGAEDCPLCVGDSVFLSREFYKYTLETTAQPPHTQYTQNRIAELEQELEQAREYIKQLEARIRDEAPFTAGVGTTEYSATQFGSPPPSREMQSPEKLDSVASRILEATSLFAAAHERCSPAEAPTQPYSNQSSGTTGKNSLRRKQFDDLSEAKRRRLSVPEASLAFAESQVVSWNFDE
eukprot:TRINITY_DN83578_c0_g1_i1.p1 TRINITY_DN83578_c0_g1~~TRINITY_DN83578_c0_g1_i1.p1  ORF type:complete len:263 (+),score=42.49 TRINITY_DN83578_c0_g1_i1:31-819(+)